MKHIFYLWSLKLIHLQIQEQKLNTDIIEQDIEYLYDQLYSDGFNGYRHLTQIINTKEKNKIYYNILNIYLKLKYNQYLFKYMINNKDQHLYKLDNYVLNNILSYVI